MTGFQLVYLIGWLVAVFDLPADNRPPMWCIGAAIGCAAWPVVLVITAVSKGADWCARNVK